MRAPIHRRMKQSPVVPSRPRSCRQYRPVLISERLGVFPRVVIIFEEWERWGERLSNEVIASQLSKIPLTPIDTFAAILRDVRQNRRADMWRMVRWLLYTSRSLAVAELEAGLTLEAPVSSCHGFAGDLAFLCGSLVRFDGPWEEISFTHQTGRGFY